jgi:ethanolamine ammonia-lyase large subunit
LPALCVVREVDAIPLELYRQFLDRVVARFELPAATCVLAHVRLNMVAVLPDASP